MYLLIPLVEAYVGEFLPSWPRVVLTFLFTLPPPSSPLHLSRLSCRQRRTLCHGDAARPGHTYEEWRSSPHVPHLGIYYNMRIHKFVWINGLFGPQLEVVPEISSNGSITGFGSNTWVLRRKLQSIRRTVPLIP
jgi:hypothetical protein